MGERRNKIMRLTQAAKCLCLVFFALSISISAQNGIPAGAMEGSPPSSAQMPVEEPPSVDVPTTGASSKHAGPPAILISRPVYAPYSAEGKTMYLSSISEGYFHLKLSALPGFQVISQEKIADAIPYFRDFSRRISRNAYIEAARSLGASYLFYQEYEPQGKKIRYSIELYSISDNQRILSKVYTINLQEFESGLEECVGAVVNALSAQVSDYTREFLTTSILGPNQKALETFGNSLASIPNYSQKQASSFVAEFDKVIVNNPKMYVAKYIAASMSIRAKEYPKAITYQSDIISTFGVSNPSLYLELASYYRIAENYPEALDAVENAAKEPTLRLLVLSARASIYEAKGDLKKAEDEYEKALSEGGDDGAIFFKLSLVNIGLNSLSAAANYLTKASDAGYQLDRGSYYDLGLRYSALGNANDKAIEAFKNSLGVQQDYEDAWVQLAKLYSKMNKKGDAAECYISLFQINNAAYKDDLLNAGEIYEGLNEMEKAKDAYALYLARKFVNPLISVKLAKLESQSGNCDKAIDLVYGLDTVSAVATDVSEINQKCGKPQRRVAIPTGDAFKKKSPAVGIWRVVSGALTLGAAGVGYYCDMQVADKQKEYKDANLKTVDKLHKDIDSFVLYRNICYASAGLAGTSLILSITLPIIFSNK
jgi:tetratricopeptide (TPR) repeat protein